MAFGMSSCDVALTLIQYCFNSGCSLRKVVSGKYTMLSSGFLPPANTLLRFSATPITVNIWPSILISLPSAFALPETVPSAVSDPRTMTGEWCSSSVSLNQRPDVECEIVTRPFSEPGRLPESCSWPGGRRISPRKCPVPNSRLNVLRSRRHSLDVGQVFHGHGSRRRSAPCACESLPWAGRSARADERRK